ncbi:methyltransferase [Oceanospirillum linum]|uniref:methyltransferase n=1 Tax=Oceanospirillum linum TaxID=966 RepID=UPI00089F1F8A|nr:methyltransferase [Oceanospirillum linum]SEF82729.1 Methyltransferase domain-containing protein [Oleiphilus messinensis]SMP19484.1 Methyltransferase domain-containing protein [Oceanospirillum linum]
MLRSLFHHADQLLTQYRPFWQMRPFYIRQLSECSQLPEHLLSKLTKLDQKEFEQLSQNSEASQQWLQPWLPCLDELEQIQRSIPGVDNSETSSQQDSVSIKHLSTGIPGRKWSQIEQFINSLPITGDTAKHKLLEWCAGKGHLGRLLSIRKGYEVTSLEWQHSLCIQGEALIHQQKKRYPQLQQRMQQGDALSDDVSRLLNQHNTAVALHACGDLHTHLISQCCNSAQAIKQLAVAPCCYHLTADDIYQPLSKAGQGSLLSLDRQDLKIPLQETVTGGQRVSRLRDIELHWRLSFDFLRQSLTGETRYKPLPAFPKKLLSGEFNDFVLWALINRELLSDNHDSDNLPFNEREMSQALTEGAEKLLVVRKLEWLQSHFRRVLEIWLVADRALALEEAGFHVELYQFCDKAVSPRNLLILARR